MSKFTTISLMLDELYPNAQCELNFHNPFELLIATILSAQCTDKRVNEITKRLFPKYNSAEKMATLTQEELISLIRDCGLFNSKSKNILATSKILRDSFNGQVPSTRKELENLPGVGRKTANVVLANAFHIPAFPVDTHVFRVAHRIGLSQGKTPEKVETNLCEIFPKDQWIKKHHQMIFHGRNLCKARNPLCEKCPLHVLCNYFLEGK